MNKLLVPMAIVLGAAIGAVSFCVASRCYTCRHREESPAIDTGKLARIEQGLGEMNSRLAKLEGKRSFEDVLADPALRAQFLAVMSEAGKADPGHREPDPADKDRWRKNTAARYRQGWAALLDEVRGTLALDGKAWAALQPIFEEHFSPVEAAIKDIESDKSKSSLVNVNTLVAPGLPATLEKLRKQLGPEKWTAFDAWRRAPQKAGAWGAGKGDYFLEGEEYKSFRVKRAAEMHWLALRQGMEGFFGRLKLGEEKTGKLEEIFKTHLERAFELVRDAPYPDLRNPKVLPKLRALTAATEEAVKQAAGGETLEAFRKWQREPGNRSAQYFGLSYRQPPRPRQPGAPPGETPAKQPGGESRRF